MAYIDGLLIHCSVEHESSNLSPLAFVFELHGVMAIMVGFGPADSGSTPDGATSPVENIGVIESLI